MNVITDTTVLPEQFESVEEAADFWDTHSLADYWDQVHEVEIEVRARLGGGSRWTRMCGRRWSARRVSAVSRQRRLSTCG